VVGLGDCSLDAPGWSFPRLIVARAAASRARGLPGIGWVARGRRLAARFALPFWGGGISGAGGCLGAACGRRRYLYFA
jgi:hypothetical protein